MSLRALFFIGVFVFVPVQSWAGGALEAQMQKKQQQQQAMQGQMYQAQQQAVMQAQQQMMAQRDQAMRQAQQQAIAQRQQALYQQQQQAIVAQRQQALYQQQQQAIAQRKQQIQYQTQQQYQAAAANQLAQARQQAAAIGVAQNYQAQAAAQMQNALQGAGGQINFDASLPQFADPSQVQDTKTMKDVWKELETSSEVWPLIIETEPKMITVERQIGLFRNEGVRIEKSATHYIEMIDGLSSQNPSMLQRPFREVIKFIAILEYDYNDGRQDKDTLARKVLGEAGYLANRRRLGLQ